MLDPKHIRHFGGHAFWQGPRTIQTDNGLRTPAQIVLKVSDKPVFSSCGFPTCINPDHLHISIIATRLQEAS